MVQALAKELGWEEDLNRLWAETDLEKNKAGQKERKKGKAWTPPSYDEVDEDSEAATRVSEPTTVEEDVSEALEELEENLSKLAVDDEDLLAGKEKATPSTVTSGSDDSEKGAKEGKSADESSVESEKKSDHPKKLPSSTLSARTDKLEL